MTYNHPTTRHSRLCRPCSAVRGRPPTAAQGRRCAASETARTSPAPSGPRLALALVLGLLLLPAAGCGTTKSQVATEQLLASDAVDRNIAKIDFSPLSGHKVYLDSTYVKAVKGMGFVNADYIISSLRQQLFAYRCLVMEKQEEADIVLEARVGALGTDGREIIYGIPASNSLRTAAQIVPNAPPIPTTPEISVAKRDKQIGASKIAVFAYDRQTRERVFQSGVVTSLSDANHMWVFGAGPFERGSVYEIVDRQNKRSKFPFLKRKQLPPKDASLAAYATPIDFQDRGSGEDDPDQQSSRREPNALTPPRDAKPAPKK